MAPTAAEELMQPLRPGLVAVPGVPQPGICGRCHSSASDGYATCPQCGQASFLAPPEVLPISMSIERDLLHHHLRFYKDSPDAAVRDRFARRLAALLAVFMRRHAECIGEWDYMTCVPSVKRVAMTAITDQLQVFAGRHHQVLRAVAVTGDRVLGGDRFQVPEGLTGDRVLLVDDTFTSGSSMFSAARALARAGAVVVGPVVIGRHVRPSWTPSAEMLAWLADHPWQEDQCCRCGGAFQNAPPLF